MPASPPAGGGAGGEDGDLAGLRLECADTQGPASPARASARRRRGAAARQAPSAGLHAAAEEELEVRDEDWEQLAPAASPAFAQPGPDFRIDDDLFEPRACDSGVLEAGFPALEAPGTEPSERPRPLFSLDGPEEPATRRLFVPIIESEDEVPERFWAPEGARLPRRAAAFAVDLALLGGAAALFWCGAFVALRLAGISAGLLLSPAGLSAALPPVALLGLLASLISGVACHARAGRTPGKRLLRLEVRTPAGVPPTPAAAFRRWLGAVLGLACAGVGVGWALFDTRRRGWADLASGTVVAERREGGPGAERR